MTLTPDLRSMLPLLNCIMWPGGTFSFFNGLAPFNAFYYEVYCRIVKDDLRDEGWDVHYIPLRVGTLGNSVWQGLRSKYWALDVYNVPVVRRAKLNA